MAVFAVANEVRSTRLGISVGRAYGPAVQRNRIKRLIREAFRLVRHRLPTGIDFIVVPRKHNDEPTVEALQMSICRLCLKLRERVK